MQHNNNLDTYILSGMWVRVDLRMDTKKRYVLKRDLTTCLTNMLTTLGSIINMNEEDLWPLNEHKNFHFERN